MRAVSCDAHYDSSMVGNGGRGRGGPPHEARLDAGTCAVIAPCSSGAQLPLVCAQVSDKPAHFSAMLCL